MATWKKVIVSGSNISQLFNDAGYVASVGGGIVSASSLSSPAQGEVAITVNGVTQAAVDLGLQTGDSPQFATIEVGNASDTTLSRSAAGRLAVEGNNLLRASGDSVVSSSAQIAINSTTGTLNVNKGGTGTTTLASGQVLIGNGTSAVQTRAIGIADNNIVEIDSTTVADNEYARFTANGLESRTAAEVFTDITAGTGTISGSAQLNLADLTDGNGIVDFTYDGSSTAVITLDTASAHFTNGVVDALPAGTVSGSSQITLAGDVTGQAGANTVVKVQGVALTSGEATQIANINSVTISNTQWGYVGSMDQGVATTDNVTFNDVIVSNNLTVQGTLTSINTDNLNIEDKFILLNSGSTSGDSGIIFGGTGAGVGNAGHAIFCDDSQGNGTVFGFAENLAWNATTGGTPTSKLGNIIELGSAGSAGMAGATFQGVGTILVDSADDIWIQVAV